ncbi:glycoside hydrolase family 15 protein [soil metagenome]
MPEIDYQRDSDGFLPIEAYGAIGSGRTVALVGSDGSIDWCPFPRIDSPSTFGRILNVHKGGYWQIKPRDQYTTSRHYLEDTNILVTRFETATGSAEIVDFMPTLGFGADLGVNDRIHDGMIVRIVRGVRGKVEMRQELFAAFNYGRDGNEYEIVDGRGALVCGPSEYLSILCQAPLERFEGGLATNFNVAENEEQHFVCTHHNKPAPIWLGMVPGMVQRLFNNELLGWRSWIGRCTYDGPYADAVRRGALTLKMLDYLPTGAVAAAATTSLPEHIGGVRNWDYRYAWIRDTTYVLYTLISIGYREEAESFFQWVIDATDIDPSRLKIMYRVDGGHELEELELDHLSGYKHSAPVRIGNKAANQRQLDVYGEVLDAAHTYRMFGGFISRALWTYLVNVANEVLIHWKEPDAGIWEVRSEPRRMTYSNVMCWVALDRAIKLAELDDREAPVDEWRAVKEQIREDVMTLGVSPERGAFVEAFGGQALDASALSFPLRHFIEANHPIMKATIEAIDRELAVDGLVARYKVEADNDDNLDGLPGDEGHFVITSCWMIDCLTALHEFDRAKEAIEQMLARANDLGLFAEQIDSKTGQHLGNFPQAFSHLAITNAIVNYARVTGQIAAHESAAGEHPSGGLEPAYGGVD